MQLSWIWCFSQGALFSTEKSSQELYVCAACACHLGGKIERFTYKDPATMYQKRHVSIRQQAFFGGNARSSAHMGFGNSLEPPIRLFFACDGSRRVFPSCDESCDPIPANGFLELLVSVINCRDRRPMPQPSSLGESTGSSATVWTTQTQRYLEVRDLHTLD